MSPQQSLPPIRPSDIPKQHPGILPEKNSRSRFLGTPETLRLTPRLGGPENVCHQPRPLLSSIPSLGDSNKTWLEQMDPSKFIVVVFCLVSGKRREPPKKQKNNKGRQIPGKQNETIGSRAAVISSMDLARCGHKPKTATSCGAHCQKTRLSFSLGKHFEYPFS